MYKQRVRNSDDDVVSWKLTGINVGFETPVYIHKSLKPYRHKQTNTHKHTHKHAHTAMHTHTRDTHTYTHIQCKPNLNNLKQQLDI